MKRYSTALLICTLSLAGQLAHADMIDDAIGNIQQAINDAYHPGDSRSDDDDYDDGRYQDSRQQSADANLTSASASLIGTAVSWKATSASWMMIIDTARPAAFAAPA